jgi:hypothetical protein
MHVEIKFKRGGQGLTKRVKYMQRVGFESLLSGFLIPAVNVMFIVLMVQVASSSTYSVLVRMEIA